MRVLISGASGMIGGAIAEALRTRGDEVGALVRGDTPAGALDVRWDPHGESIDTEQLAAGRYDAVLHLAGESLLGRWTDAKRERIRDSRTNGTRVLAQALAQLPTDMRPPSLLVASATGYYGNRAEELLTESSTPGDDFLAGVVAAWEAAADPAREAGIRTLHLRMAPVQSPRGGALKAQLLPFRLGVGGRVGTGRQWAAWIGLHEAVDIWLYLLDNPDVDGVINVVGPTPVRNCEYVRALGRVLHRPTVLPAPIPLMKLALGKRMIEETVLTSHKVVPARLEGLGYEFRDRTIEDALRRELQRTR